MKILEFSKKEFSKKIFMGVFLVAIAFVLFNTPSPQTAIVPTNPIVEDENSEGPITESDKTNPELGANMLYIARLGVKVPIIYVNSVDEAEFQKGLEKGVVHYPGTAGLGELGNVYIFGHSSDYRFARGSYKTVFARLSSLVPGDKIITTDGAKKQYSYIVREGRVVEKDDLSVLGQYDWEKRLLTLQTSWPVGTANKRYVIIAELE